MLTEPQELFVFSDAKFPAIVGGLGSGKSKGGTIRLIVKLLSDKGANGGYYMPTFDLLRLRALPGIEADLEQMGIAYSTNKSEYTVDILGHGKIILRSYDRPERIIAYETAHSIVDELDTLSKEKAALVWRKITERNRQNRDGINTIGLVTTPDQGLNGFVYEKWEKIRADGYVSYKAPTTSNPFLPEGYIEQIRSNYDPLLAEMYINGEYVSLTSNKVYHFYSRAKHHSALTTDDDQYLHIGLDFNVGGTCAVVFILRAGQPIAVDEFVSHDTYDFVNNLCRYDGKRIIIYPDASGANRATNAAMTDIGIITNAGFSVYANPANPAVRDRINAVNALLSHDNLLINADKCPNYAHALETQGYTKKSEPEKYAEHPAVDDWADSSGYFLAYKYPVAKPAFTTDMRINY